MIPPKIWEFDLWLELVIQSSRCLGVSLDKPQLVGQGDVSDADWSIPDRQTRGGGKHVEIDEDAGDEQKRLHLT